MTEPARARTVDTTPVVDLLPPLRRYVAARVRDRHDVDDVVQETVERVLAAREPLDPDAALGYALVVARNVLADRARQARRASRNAPRVIDIREPLRPEDAVIAKEERRALEDALTVLPPEHRDQLLTHVLADVPLRDLAAASGTSEGSTAAQLARTRAKLRLEFVLAIRRAELPTARCRPILLALSAGDTRRQKALRAGQHLLHCETCSMLSRPLLERRSALAGLLPWLGLGAAAAFLRRLWRTYPRQVTAGAVTGVAAATAVAAVAVGTTGQDRAASPPSPAATVAPAVPGSVPAPAPGEVRLVRTGERILPGAPPDLVALAGEAVSGREVPVAAVVADEGMWVGDGRGRVWVQLRTAGGESPPAVRPGQRITFEGAVTAHDAGFAAVAGVSAAEDAALLRRQGAHLTVDVARLGLTGG
jgi:RNA polymerase sigma factor (sigma-70 family)